jgi:hypothetical protein
MIRWMGNVALMREKRNTYRVLVGKAEGKKPAGRPKPRWEGTIEMDLREIGWSYMNRIHLAEVRDQWRTLGTR